MKLRDLLEQLVVELNVPTKDDAYTIEKEIKTNLGYGDFYIYTFQNSNKDLMEVTCLITKFPKEPGKSIFIAFGLHDPDKDLEAPPEDDEEEKKYNTQTGAGDMLKVMATVVEAVRRTFEKIGGEDKVYAIRYAPADIKRKNIYDHYIKTLFPNFKKDLNSSSTGFTVLINKDFKGKEVNEVGLEKEKTNPYLFTTEEDSDERRVYSFKTPSGLRYIVELDEYEPVDSPGELSKVVLYGDDLDDKIPDDKKRRVNSTILMIQFGVVDDEEITLGSNQNVVTNKGELYRVMNTVAAIIREDLGINQYIKYIAFDPAKRSESNPKSKKERDTDISSNSRANLYTKYILGRIPKAEILPNNMFDVLVKVK